MINRITYILLISLLLSIVPSFGEKKSIQLKKLSQQPILDGNFDDDCWREVEWIDDFVQSEPVRKAPPSEKTEFKVIWHGSSLYFAVKCYDSHPEEIMALERRREGGMWSDDTFEIRLDTYLDKRNYYSFRFNPRGTKRDEKWGNLDWDGDWDVVAKITKEGWVAEVRISLMPLAFPRKGEGYFGINFQRRIRRLREENLWSFTMDIPERVDDFGLIGPIDFSSIPFNSRMETLLYGVGGAGPNTSWHMGLDAHKFITPDFKYALTLYPDYSDIEAVYESIDISYTERWLPEKRPFFTEGSEYFGTFYSRRIDKFDFGFKAFGVDGKKQIGFLNCTLFSPFRNDTLFNYSYNITHQSSIAMTLQSRYEENRKNILLGGGGGKGTSNFATGIFYVTSFTEPGSNGYIYHWDLWKRLGERSGLFINYSGVSPDFQADLQLIEQVGIKNMNVGVYYSDVSPRGKKWWESYGINASYGYLNYWSGGRMAEWKGAGFSIGLRGDMSLGIERTLTFYNPFRDNFTNFSFGIGSPEKRFSLGFSYGKGIRTNLPYKFASGSIGRQLLKDRLNISLNFEKRWVGVGNAWLSAQQLWGSISYDIGKDFWLVLRTYNLQDSESHNNISGLIRRRGEGKGDFYLVLGDPLGTDTKERIAVKYIVPW